MHCTARLLFTCTQNQHQTAPTNATAPKQNTPPPCTPPDGGKASAGGVAAAHITNFAQNENGEVWDLNHLAGHLGAGKWRGLWVRRVKTTALVFASALRRIQEVQAQMDLPPK